MRFEPSAGSAIADLLEVLASSIAPLIGLFGVIVGAAVAALLARTNNARSVVTDIRREVYFETMDLAVSLYEQLRVIGSAGPRGGSDPAADQQAAEAVQALIDLLPRFARSEARVATVGSPAATEAAYEFRRATDEYMSAVFEASRGQMFRVGVATLYFGRYASTLDRLARAIRADLGLPPLTMTLPVTREALERAAKLPPPRWCPDPTGRYEFRWWNGAFWDHSVVSNGVQTTDVIPVRTAL